eukprot:Sspe_Gene.108678::Locus_87799_Transcript_1_1_Confidence_1.000_Length_1224::g.108678::m.108678/K08281/pncA; nicotinamidase/pyrazinamidase
MKNVLHKWESLLAEGGVAPRKLDRGLRKNDVVIVVDMQKDFFSGGPVEVPEADAVVPEVVQLLEAAMRVRCPVMAVRSYHPTNHCCFTGQGGAFPSHCVQGTAGCDFHPKIRTALAEARKDAVRRKDFNCYFCFKGFCEDVPSPGAFAYPLNFATQRLAIDFENPQLEWSGAFELRCSNIAEDTNAPPDLRAVLRRTALRDLLWKETNDSTRVFICGLSFDHSVLDTACCAVLAGVRNVHIVFDATRPRYAPGVGRYNGGFFSSPSEVSLLLSNHSITLCYTSDLLK